jgi:hypothetical protein
MMLKKTKTQKELQMEKRIKQIFEEEQHLDASKKPSLADTMPRMSLMHHPR